jgi:hypothetical protein
MWHVLRQKPTLKILTDDLDDFEPGSKPTLLEITPDAEQTARFWAAYERLVK